MKKLSSIGRVFYGLAIAETGLQTIYYHDFPYWLVPPKHAWVPGIDILAYVYGLLLLVAGAFIAVEKRTRTISLLLGGLLLAVFFLCYIPYQFTDSARLMNLLVWENAFKELAIAAGAFILAGCYSATNEPPHLRTLAKFIPMATITFALIIMNFSLLHFLYAKDVSTMVPAWIPGPIFWAYFGGVALLGSGLAILLKIKVSLAAALLGTMTFLWVVILHIPRIIDAPAPYLNSEVTSAFIALAYSGTAFIIAGSSKR